MVIPTDPGWQARRSSLEGYVLKKRGFTLIELLAVMGIVVLMASIVAGSYFGMMRGAGMRTAVGNLQSSLMVARQRAIMDGKRVYIMFSQTATQPGEYVLCQMMGQATAPTGGKVLADQWNPDLANMYPESYVYNLRRGLSFKIQEVPVFQQGVAPKLIMYDNGAFATGDRYGFEIQPRQSLPVGFRFGSGGSDELPASMMFKRDGTVVKLVSGIEQPMSTITVNIYEELSDKTFKLEIAGSGFMRSKAL